MVADVHFALMANYFSFTLAFLHIFAHVLHHSMSIVLCEVFRVFAQSSIQIFLDCFLLIRIFLYFLELNWIKISHFGEKN